jgi:hypothetical protein
MKTVRRTGSLTPPGIGHAGDSPAGRALQRQQSIVSVGPRALGLAPHPGLCVLAGSMAQSACPGPATRLVALLLLGLIRVYRHWISPLLGPRCHPSSLTVVDVDDDPALQARFGLEVPVLLMPAEGAPPRPLPRVPPRLQGAQLRHWLTRHLPQPPRA